MAPTESQARGRPLSVAGRASVSPPLQSKSYDDKHQAYLRKLQERNLQQKLQREAEDLRNADRIRREQGFSLCFSGANERKTSAPLERHRRPSLDGAGKGMKQWEEATVEIRGQGGEVHALRPSGERRCLPPRLPGMPQATAEASGLASRQGNAVSPRLDQVLRLDHEASTSSLHSCSSTGRPSSGQHEEAADARSTSAALLTATSRELQSLLPELVHAGVITEDAEVPDAASQEEELDQLTLLERPEPTDALVACREVAAVECRTGNDRTQVCGIPLSTSYLLKEGMPEEVQEELVESIEEESWRDCQVLEQTEAEKGCELEDGATFLAGHAPNQSGPEVVSSSCQEACVPTGTELAERISRLPLAWRQALGKLVDDAESGGPPPVGSSQGGSS